MNYYDLIRGKDAHFNLELTMIPPQPHSKYTLCYILCSKILVVQQSLRRLDFNYNFIIIINLKLVPYYPLTTIPN